MGPKIFQIGLGAFGGCANRPTLAAFFRSARPFPWACRTLLGPGAAHVELEVVLLIQKDIEAELVN